MLYVVFLTWTIAGLQRDGTILGEVEGLGEVDGGVGARGAIELRDQLTHTGGAIRVQAAQSRATIRRWLRIGSRHVRVAWQQRRRCRVTVRGALCRLRPHC